MISRRALMAGGAALAASRMAAAAPAAFPLWLPRPTISGAGLDKVAIEIPQRFMPTRGAEIWIAPDGRDRGAGSFARPFATLQYAFDRPEAVICCMPGRYAPAELAGRAKAIFAPYGDVVIATPGRDLSSQVFRRADRNGVYVATLPRTLAPLVILSRESIDDFGYERRLPNSSEGWQYDAQSSELRISLGGRNVNEVRHQLRALYINPYNRGSLLLVTGGRLSIGKGVTLEGVGIWARPDRGSKPVVILDHMRILFAQGNSLTMLGGDALATNVRAHACQVRSFQLRSRR
jgi:hypothetical protein